MVTAIIASTWNDCNAVFDKLVTVTIASGRAVPTRSEFNRCNNYCYFSGQVPRYDRTTSLAQSCNILVIVTASGFGVGVWNWKQYLLRDVKILYFDVLS